MTAAIPFGPQLTRNVKPKHNRRRMSYGLIFLDNANMDCPRCGKPRTGKIKLFKRHRYYVCENGHPLAPVRDVSAGKRPTAQKGYGR